RNLKCGDRQDKWGGEKRLISWKRTNVDKTETACIACECLLR
ncbi:hypothetical protein LINPERPRIM_LOCUS30587, partial [Linum perenne]